MAAAFELTGLQIAAHTEVPRPAAPGGHTRRRSLAAVRFISTATAVDVLPARRPEHDTTAVAALP